MIAASVERAGMPEAVMAAGALPQAIAKAKPSCNLVSRESQPEDTVVRVGPAAIGGARFAVIAGPCSVESAEQMVATALAVRAAGAT